MNIEFYKSHMETLKDLMDIAKKHNSQIYFGTKSSSSIEIDKDILLKCDIAENIADIIIGGDLIVLGQFSSDEKRIWFELYEIEADKRHVMSYVENNVSFIAEINEYYKGYDEFDYNYELIEKYLDEHNEYGDNFFSFSSAPTIIRGFGNKNTIQDFRVYRSGMALSFFSDLVCDYFKESRIKRTY